MRIDPVQTNFMGRNILGKEAIRFIPSSAKTDLENSIQHYMDIFPTPATVKKFANGETYVNICEDMRNKDVYIIPTI